MRALVIAPQPFFTPRGTPFSVYYRTLIKAELGVKIDFLTYGQGDDCDIPGVRYYRIPRFRWLGNVKIGPSYLKLFLDVFIFVWAVGLLARNRYDFVHVHEEAAFMCLFLKPLFKFKMVYDMHSSLPQQLTNFRFTNSRIIVNVFKKLEDLCLMKSDAVITICPDLYNYVNGVIDNRGKHLLIENSIFDQVKLRNGRDNHRVHDTTAREEASLNLDGDRKYVVYAGTLEPYQGIDILISAFVKVSREKSDTDLLIAGGAKEQVEKYRTMARTLGIEHRCVFTGLLPQNLVKDIFGKAMVLISPRCDGTNTPLKIYEYLDSGKPIVATNIYSHTQVLNDGVAYLVRPEAEEMACGILAALSQSRGRDEKVNNAKKLYQEKYSRDVYKAKVKKLLEILS